MAFMVRSSSSDLSSASLGIVGAVVGLDYHSYRLFAHGKITYFPPKSIFALSFSISEFRSVPHPEHQVRQEIDFCS